MTIARRALVALPWPAAAVLLWPVAAAAHSFSVAYSRLDVSADRRAAAYELRIAAADLTEVLGARDAVDADAIRAGADRIAAYAAKRVSVEGDGTPCAAAPQVDVAAESALFARLRWQCAWPAPIRTIALDYDLFFDDLDPNHTGMVEATYRGHRVTATLTADASRFEWDLAAAPPATVWTFVQSGVHHILDGPDHLLFLLGLLLVAAARRVRDMLAIVTSFTAAHSITLILAALSIVTLPSRVVESAIALSIVWIAVGNLAVREPRHRAAVTFAFGLLHGMGFAAMLRPLLPPSGVVGPLLAFNVGVELGQLAVVAVAMPLLAWLHRRAGRAGYRRFVVVPGSVGVAIAGTLWLVERALDVALW
ncbi:MAG: HupE/UreJ family protein [Deltaproteobacteria bacterium]|nr:MAG: HupE/UreJ family protein [Deltaproteobacteria bacterium]